MLAEVARPRNAPPLEHRVRGYDGPRQTILVVDDDQVHRDLIGELLEPLGFNVMTAANGATCLALVNERRPNLILLDISMPDMDGWTVARQLRQTLRERPAIIMLSAIAMEEERAVEPDRLYDDYMIKPIDLRQLLEKFHTLLDIEWTTHEGFAEAEVASAPPLPTKRLALDAIVALIGLGQIGHFRGISATLDEIEANSPDQAASVAELRSIVNTFNLSRFLTVLEAQRRSHAP
jgi:CheY-like chemotaxis protein